MGLGDDVSICTDASPWGIGAYLEINGVIVEYLAGTISQAEAELLGHVRGGCAGQQAYEALAAL
eukprot:5551248-Heterocapsa_arctica.AAC.1